MAARHPNNSFSIAGKPLLAWTLERLLSCGLSGLTVALPEEWLHSTAEIFPGSRSSLLGGGGATRQLSVPACLAGCPADADLVLVHDGARPAVAVRTCWRQSTLPKRAMGAILGRPVADTLKRVDEAVE